MKYDKNFILEKEKEFTNAYGEAISDLGQLISGDDDSPKYERVSWAIDDLNKMVQAFEQVMAGYYNEWSDAELKHKDDVK